MTLKVKVQGYVTTDRQSASLSWNKAPIWGLRPNPYYRLTFAGLLMWGSLSGERTGLSSARVTCQYEQFSQSHGYVTTDGQSACLSWNKASFWGLRPIIFIVR
jgi:hypothetical protein